MKKIFKLFTLHSQGVLVPLSGFYYATLTLLKYGNYKNVEIINTHIHTHTHTHTHTYIHTHTHTSLIRFYKGAGKSTTVQRITGRRNEQRPAFPSTTPSPPLTIYLIHTPYKLLHTLLYTLSEVMDRKEGQRVCGGMQRCD